MMYKKLKNQKSNENITIKRIIMVVIIILLLLLITSCNSNFLGKIGDFFDNSSSYKIEDENNTLEKEKNTLLKFVKNKGETFVDESYKIEFISNLNTKKYNCTTSNAEIATCKVKGNYVQVYPKKKGTVIISIHSKVNGKEYIGTHKLKIKESNRNIKLSSISGVIDLNKENIINVFYKLNNINGDVVVTSSNEKVATAVAKNGVLTIKAYKKGNSIITLKVVYKGKEFIANYELIVYGRKWSYKPFRKEKYENKHNKISKEDISSLEKIEVIGFDTTIINSNKYKSTVKYDTPSIALNVVKTNPLSTVKYIISNQNGAKQEIKDISDIVVTEGDNIITMVVTSESNKNSTIYTLTVHKPIRKVEIINEFPDILVENKTTDILFNIKDDNNLVSDYDYNEIAYSVTPNFNGNIKVKKGKISITPDLTDLGKTFDLTLKCFGKTSTTTFTVKIKDYYAKFNSDEYDLTYLEDIFDQYIIVNTNIFSDDNNINKTIIENGIRLSNSIGYLDVISSNKDLLSFDFDQEHEDITSSLALLTKINGEGNVIVTISGQAYGKTIKQVQSKVSISSKFKVTIDALDGFFNSFTKKYKLLLNKDEIIKLSDYIAYLVDDPQRCTYFELDSYNTSPDGTGTKYDLNQEIVNQNLVLYAIYNKKDGSKPIEINDKGVMYLTDVDLFHNEEYYKKYKKDKIIYPGASGSHTMYIENNSANTISIESITITEDTMCVTNGCINMGYILRYYVKDDSSKDMKYHYFYGENNSYKVLNLDSNATKNNYDGLFSNTIKAEYDKSSPIILKPNSKNSVEIDLLWKWLNIDDEVDTEIGKIRNNTDYTITVKIEYSIIGNCKKE